MMDMNKLSPETGDLFGHGMDQPPLPPPCPGCGECLPKREVVCRDCWGRVSRKTRRLYHEMKVHMQGEAEYFRACAQVVREARRRG